MQKLSEREEVHHSALVRLREKS